MRKVFVATRSKLRQEYTHFSGDEIELTFNDDGSLTIAKWQTDTERGMTVFAVGTWVYVSFTEDTTQAPLRSTGGTSPTHTDPIL